MDAMPFPWVLWLCRCVQTTAAVLLVGTAVLRLLALGTGLDRDGCWPRLAWASWAALLIAGTLLLGLTAVEMSGASLSQALTDGTVTQVLDRTRFGEVWRWRMGLLAGWLAMQWAGVFTRRRNWPGTTILKGAEMFIDLALLAILVLAGHAQASVKSTWLLPVNMVHALAAGAWPGGLLPLWLLLARARRNAALLPVAAVVVQRFSRLSVVAVGALAFSGMMNGVGLVGNLTALVSSAYGRLVLCKAALFAAMIGVGAINRRLINRPNLADPTRTVHRLWYNVAWECVLATGVLLVTEAVAASAPPVSSD